MKKDNFLKNIKILSKMGHRKPIKDEVFHKVKVIDRRREIELQKLDNEIEDTGLSFQANDWLTGEYSKQKQRQATYEKWVWRALWTLVGLIALVGILI